MLGVCMLIFVTALILGQVGAQEDAENRTVSRDRGHFSRAITKLFHGGQRNCGDPDNCPEHHCRLDDAVVHGFCCGCAHPTDRVHVKCPQWLQCPLSPVPLCDDYNYMMDCCC